MKPRQNGQSQGRILGQLKRNNPPRIQRIAGVKRSLLAAFNAVDNNTSVPMEIEQEFKQQPQATEMPHDFSELTMSRKPR